MKLTIGENIKRLRKSKNITQEQLAEVVNLSVTAISKWERGETYPDITMLYPLAYFLRFLWMNCLDMMRQNLLPK